MGQPLPPEAQRRCLRITLVNVAHSAVSSLSLPERHEDRSNQWSGSYSAALPTHDACDRSKQAVPPMLREGNMPRVDAHVHFWVDVPTRPDLSRTVHPYSHDYVQ